MKGKGHSDTFNCYSKMQDKANRCSATTSVQWIKLNSGISQTLQIKPEWSIQNEKAPQLLRQNKWKLFPCCCLCVCVCMWVCARVLFDLLFNRKWHAADLFTKSQLCPLLLSVSSSILQTHLVSNLLPTLNFHDDFLYIFFSLFLREEWFENHSHWTRF